MTKKNGLQVRKSSEVVLKKSAHLLNTTQKILAMSASTSFSNICNSTSEHVKAILLLTCYFNNSEFKQFKPLTVNEYGYLACWLQTNKFTPVSLLNVATSNQIFTKWNEQQSHIQARSKIDFRNLDKTISNITQDRLQSLLGRSSSLSKALEKWTHAGIWILDRSHPNYPKIILEKLKDQAPAILFGVGDQNLLQQSYIGFVGSSDFEDQDKQATKKLVQIANVNHFGIVSGASKGVASCAMLASLDQGFTSLGVVSENLYRQSASAQWRQHIKSNKLVLISFSFPEASFSPANAMFRNKFIYLLSCATVVIRSSTSTWAYAIENLKKGWVPLLVSEHLSPNYPANQALLNGEIKDALFQPKKIIPSLSANDFLNLLKL